MRLILVSAFLVTFLTTFGQNNNKTLPQGFVYISDYIPNIAQDLRYCNHHNFVGRPIEGYHAPKLILTKEATVALHKVEAELNRQNMGLKVFDAYRPQTAVNHFQKWAKQIQDTIAKAEFYPQVDKRNLFKLGYIASKSGHSRGSTIDLTIIDLKNGNELDMGSPFDFFGERSYHTYTRLTDTQQNNRNILKNVMMKYGFKPYDKEWWHYTLSNEPFPKMYFDFKVE